MPDTVVIDAFDLSGPALDWAVAKAVAQGTEPDGVPAYSTDWAVGGPVIEAHGVSLRRDMEDYSEPDRPWYAEHGVVFWANGDTMLVAGCRALVMGLMKAREIPVPAGLAG